MRKEIGPPPPTHDNEYMEDQDQDGPQLVGKHTSHHPHRPQDRCNEDVADKLATLFS